MSNPTRRRSWTLALASLLLFAVTACGEALTSADTSIVESEPATSVPGDAVATTSSSTTVASSSAAKNDAADDSSGTVGAVFAEATFDVTVTEDVVYAQGLTHDEWDSDDAEPTDLLLDVYEPVRSDDVVMPALVVIHGGGWQGGTKERLSGFVDTNALLKAGISVVAINYRLISHALEEKVTPPVKAPLHDAARALQFVRSKAEAWILDKEKVGAAGGTAGSSR